MKALHIYMLLIPLLILSQKSMGQVHNTPYTGLPSQWSTIHYFDAIGLNKGNKMFIGGRNSAGYLSWGAYPDQTNAATNEARFWANGNHSSQIIYSSWGKSMEFRFSDPSINPSKGSFVNWVSVMNLNNNGSVGIGTTNISSGNGYRLFVADGIATEKIKVSLEADFPDYVFRPTYNLLSLSEVAEHIQKKGHLHNTPSAAEIKSEGGFELKAITLNQQEKIEEIYLHLIKMKDELDELKKENETLKQQLTQVRLKQNAK